MSALPLSFLSNPTIIAILGGVVGAVAWGFKQRLAGAKAERKKQAEAETKARDIADEVDNDLRAMTPAQAREALQRWSKS